MGIFLWVVAITAIAGVGGTGVGGAISACIRKDSAKTVSLFLSFAAGVMLAVVCFDLIMDALGSGGSVSLTNLLLTAGGVVLGFAVVALLNYLIDRSTNHEVAHVRHDDHPKTADDLDELIHSDHYLAHEKGNNNLFMAGLIMAAAIALHNLPEGMVIGSAYATGAGEAEAWGGSGFLLAVIIGLHNIPEGMAVAVPLIAGGMKKGRAVCITALSGAPTILGAMFGFWLGTLGDTWNTISLSFASGAMLYVVFGELLPESILMWRSKLPSVAILIGMLVGLLIIFL